MPARRPVLGAALATLVVAAAIGCAPSTPSPSAPTEPRAFEAERDGIILTATIEREPLVAGGRSWLTVVIANRTNLVQTWLGGGCNIPASIWVDVAAEVAPETGRNWGGMAGRFKDLLGVGEVPPSNRGYFVEEGFVDQGQIACTADLKINDLEPGTALRQRSAWDGEVNGVAAPTGPAVITVSYPHIGPRAAGDDPFGEPNPITLRIETAVVDGGVRVVAPAVAVDAALAHPAFSDWVAESKMSDWQGVNLAVEGQTYVVSLQRLVDGVVIDGRVVVDRTTGAVLSFDRGPLAVP